MCKETKIIGAQKEKLAPGLGVPGTYFDFSEDPNQVYCLHYLEAGPLHPK